MLQHAMSSSERGGVPAIAATLFARESAAQKPAIVAVIACVLGERRDHPDVEDCASETLRRALEGRSRLRDGEPMRPWLLGIARHVAIDLRRKRRRERAMESPRDADDREPLAHSIPDPTPPPDERAAKAERARRITAALDVLTQGQREAMVLFHVEGEGYQQIAERMGVPLGTVATWLSRGRRTLAEALAEPLEQGR